MQKVFFSIRTILMGLCLTLGLMAAVSAEAQSGKITAPLAENTYVIEVPFRPYGSMLYAIVIRNVGGKVAVCGQWAVGDRLQAYVKSTQLPRKMRGVTKVLVGKTILLTGVSFFDEVATGGLKVGNQASCQVTHVPWKASYSNKDIDVHIPRKTVFE